MDPAVIGMVLIILSWILQILSFIKNKDKVMIPSFAGVQALGIILLAYSGFSGDSSTLGILNLLSAIGAIVCLLIILKK